ncbi:MAG: hypothetical protein EA403_01570, partial [Spirochaetaceae bacterium]
QDPRGTSGRPSLEVLKGSGITNVLLTTVRYFGGVKLGTGGLVRVYADAVKAVALVAHTEPLVELSELRLELSYEVCEAAEVDRVLAAATDASRGAVTWEASPRSRFS